MATTIFSGWLLVAGIFFLLWIRNVRETNAGWVDFGWSLSLVLLVGWYASMTEGELWRRCFYLALAGAWGVRLAGYLWKRIHREEKEDPRYAELRAHWGKSANARFFLFFQAQGAANLLLTAPILLLMNNPKTLPTLWDGLGLLVIVGAVVGETVADQQLARFKADPANKGRTCRRGLWAWSRHPNYFFEWLHWMGYPVLGGALLGTSLAVYWPLTLLGPLVMFLLLLQFTGIPYTEKQALKSRGEDYRAYQREVSAFFPRPPRSPSSTS